MWSINNMKIKFEVIYKNDKKSKLLVGYIPKYDISAYGKNKKEVNSMLRVTIKEILLKTIGK